MHRLVSLAVFLVLVVVATAVGGQFVGGDWYYVLFTPSWTPSAMAMASVWSVLYVLMALSAWMIWDAMRGLAIAAQYMLVMGVFRVAPTRFVIGDSQPVDPGGFDRYQGIQANQTGGGEPGGAVGSVAGICLGPQFFPMAYERWRPGVCYLIRHPR